MMRKNIRRINCPNFKKKLKSLFGFTRFSQFFHKYCKNSYQNYRRNLNLLVGHFGLNQYEVLAG